MTNKPVPSDSSFARGTVGVELAIWWDDQRLLVRHLSLQSVFWLVEKPGRHGEQEFVLPEGTIGMERLPLVLAYGEHDVRLVVPPTARATIRVADGERIELEPIPGEHAGTTARLVKLEAGIAGRVELGRLAFDVHIVERAARIRPSAWRSRLRRAGAFAAVSLFLHAGLGACSYYRSAPHDPDGEMTEEQRYLVQHYLDGIAEREMEEREAEVVDEASDLREGGTGTRAKGAEGAMGSASQPSASRYGVVGPSDSPDPGAARAAALRDAGEFGVVAMLSVGAGGDPDAPTAPWGRDDSLGTDPIQARGNAWGSGHAGSSAGLGGPGGARPGAQLGLSGYGNGGGGLGHGSGHGRLGYGHPALPGGPGGPTAAGPAGAPWPTIEQPPPQRRVIDPNGRFATTYRPGRGYLAAFDSAMARGTIPTSARELVSEVGARHAPDLRIPVDRSLAYSVELERAALPPEGGPVHLRVALRSSDAPVRVRPRLSVHVALDTSGSMQGAPLERAKEATSHLVEQLAPTDEFSLTTFSSGASVSVPAGLVGPRRRAIVAAIRSASSGGSTNIGQALEHAYAQATRRAAAPDVVPVVMLLSDGKPTAGIHDRTELSFIALQAFQTGIQTSTFGLGTDYDAALMSGIASDGAGGYYYLQSADQITGAFHSELRQRLEPAATTVEVRIRLDADVSLLNVYGSRRLDERESAIERAKEVASDAQAERRGGIARDRQRDQAGGMRFFIPAFGRADAYSLLVELDVPPGAGTRSLGSFELRYKDLVHGANVGEEEPIRVRFAPDAAASAATLNVSVARTIQGHAAGEDLLAASRAVALGSTGSAVSLLRERHQILLRAAESLREPGLARDADRFSGMLALLEGPSTPRDSLAVAMVFETAARSHLQ